MTLTHMHERVPAAERIAVRCVDSDVHPVPKRGEITQYIPSRGAASSSSTTRSAS